MALSDSADSASPPPSPFPLYSPKLDVYKRQALVGYSAGGVILQLVTATANDLFPHIKGTITSIVMIMSSLSNYTILSVAGTMDSAQILMMNIVITVIGVLLALFVNLRFQKLAGK